MPRGCSVALPWDRRTFGELFAALEPYIDDLDRRWEYCLRIKVPPQLPPGGAARRVPLSMRLAFGAVGSLLIAVLASAPAAVADPSRAGGARVAVQRWALHLRRRSG